MRLKLQKFWAQFRFTDSRSIKKMYNIFASILSDTYYAEGNGKVDTMSSIPPGQTNFPI